MRLHSSSVKGVSPSIFVWTILFLATGTTSFSFGDFGYIHPRPLYAPGQYVSRYSLLPNYAYSNPYYSHSESRYGFPEPGSEHHLRYPGVVFPGFISDGPPRPQLRYPGLLPVPVHPASFPQLKAAQPIPKSAPKPAAAGVPKAPLPGGKPAPKPGAPPAAPAPGLPKPGAPGPSSETAPGVPKPGAPPAAAEPQPPLPAPGAPKARSPGPEPYPLIYPAFGFENFYPRKVATYRDDEGGEKPAEEEPKPTKPPKKDTKKKPKGKKKHSDYEDFLIMPARPYYSPQYYYDNSPMGFGGVNPDWKRFPSHQMRRER